MTAVMDTNDLPHDLQRHFRLDSPLNYQRPYSYPLPRSYTVAGETPPYHNTRVGSSLAIEPEDGVYTVVDLIRRGATKWGDHPAIGFRTEVRIHEREGPVDSNGDKKQLVIPELSSYKFLSYIEYQELISYIGAGLVQAGLRPSLDKICMWAQTSAQWLSIYHGAASQSIPIVTAYSNLGLSGLQSALTSTDSVAIYVDSSSISRLATTLESVPSLRLVVYRNDVRILSSTIEKLISDFRGVTFVEMDELCALGKAHSATHEPRYPSPQDLCAIMYTSGSTGNPKGVPIRHENVVAAVAGWDVVNGRHFNQSDVYLAYLPLAHIMEFISEHVFMFWGVTIGYGSPRTIFDSSVENCKGDLRELRPTFMVGVPAIWESARKTIITSISKKSPDVQKEFWDALRDKQNSFEEGRAFSSERDAVTFSGVRGIFGGRLRFTMTGGSGIAKRTQEFISFAVAPITGGFGMTETTGTGAWMDPTQWNTGSLGGMHGSVEIKLIDYEEAGYFTSKPQPEGEICIRGASVVGYYWKDEEETRKAFTHDGWLKTGDVGRIDKHGALWIIDRKKNLIKNINGQYIALEKLESVYRSASVVSNVCIYADSTRVKPIAIIIPIEAVLNELLQSSTEKNDISEGVLAQKLVLDQLQQIAREYDLASLEIVEAVVLSPLKEWDINNGMTTAVGKLKRRAILSYHQDAIDRVRAEAASKDKFEGIVLSPDPTRWQSI